MIACRKEKWDLSGNIANKWCVIEVGNSMTWGLVLLGPQGVRVRPFPKLTHQEELLVVSR